MSLNDYKFFLFDLDDTLVKTTDIVLESMSIWCSENSIDVTQALEFSKGRRTVDTIAELAPHLEVFQEAKKIEVLEAELSKKIKPITGAVAFLNELNQSRWAIVTSSSKELAKVKINAAGLPSPKFIISAESVSRGKPNPEPYVTAIKAFDSSPSDCLVFEDAESGIQSAISAGCKTVIVGASNFPRHNQILKRIENYSFMQAVENESKRN